MFRDPERMKTTATACVMLVAVFIGLAFVSEAIIYEVAWLVGRK